MSDEQKAVDPEEQKKFANAGDDVQAHRKGFGGNTGRADEGNEDDGDDVEAHRKGFGGNTGRADEGNNDDDDNDVEAHFKTGNRL